MLKYKQIWHGIKSTRWLIKFNLTGLNLTWRRERKRERERESQEDFRNFKFAGLRNRDYIAF